MRCAAKSYVPHPEERPFGRVSKDEARASWFETALARLLTMRRGARAGGGGRIDAFTGRNTAMLRSAVVILTVALGLGLSPLHAQAPDAAYKAALADAVATNKRAGELRNQWTPTDAALNAARKAGEAGDFDKATALAKEAKALAEASIAQALREKDAWRDAVVR